MIILGQSDPGWRLHRHWSSRTATSTMADLMISAAVPYSFVITKYKTVISVFTNIARRSSVCIEQSKMHVAKTKRRPVYGKFLQNPDKIIGTTDCALLFRQKQSITTAIPTRASQRKHLSTKHNCRETKTDGSRT